MLKATANGLEWNTSAGDVLASQLTVSPAAINGGVSKIQNVDATPAMIDAAASAIDNASSASQGDVLTADGDGGVNWGPPQSGGTLYKHNVSIIGTDSMDVQYDTAINLIFISTSSTPITTQQLVNNNRAKLINGWLSSDMIISVDASGACIDVFFASEDIPPAVVYPTEIDDVVTAL